MSREMKDSGVEWIGEIPKDWKLQRVKNAFIRKKTEAHQEDPVVLSLARMGVKVRDLSKNEGQIAESYYNYNPVESGDLLLNPMDLYSGANCSVSMVELKLIQSMQKKGENQQVILTTHSPLLASVVELNNLLLIQNRKAFSMREGETMLDSSDYKFLERYLDATKANLFFAKGVIIVEGPGEALLLPTLAKLLNRNLTDYGISIVDVKSTGLRRYARIFQRKEGDKINIPVSCITDRDVMPECAPAICIDEKYEDRDNWPKKNRKWKVESEIKDKEKYIQEIEKKANGQNVKTFIPEQWTLEYELAANGLGEEMLQTIATMLAEKIQDKEKNEEKKAELLEKYRKEYNEYQNKEAKASYVYSFFSHKLVSKAEFAQQFSFDLENIFKGKQVEEIVTVLPNYLVKAIEYVTTKSEGI